VHEQQQEAGGDEVVSVLGTVCVCVRGWMWMGMGWWMGGWMEPFFTGAAVYYFMVCRGRFSENCILS
jgi:hypothetical protein